MGMYTEIYINVDLKEDTPEDVIHTIRAVCNRDKNSRYLEGKDDWWLLFNNGSYYTPSTHCGNLTYDDIGRCYSLLGKGDLKDSDAIHEFFAWIKP